MPEGPTAHASTHHCCLDLPCPVLSLHLLSCRSKRQVYFVRTAGILLALQNLYCGLYNASYGATLAKDNCGYPWVAISVLNFLQVDCLGGGGGLALAAWDTFRCVR